MGWLLKASSSIWLFETMWSENKPWLVCSSDPNFLIDEKAESRVYIGNLDLRITEAALIKMFTPYGKILSEEFLWHTRGPKRGEPRGFAFIQFSTKE